MTDHIYKILRCFILLVLLSSVCHVRLYAQGKLADSKVVILKDGSKIKGKIVETIPGEYISMILKR